MPILAWLGARVGALGAKIALAAAAVGAFLLWVARIKSQAKREGREQEARRQADAWSRTLVAVDEAGRAADARSDDAVRERLRQRATTTGSDDPVQRR